MNQPLLSILVPTVLGREADCIRLVNRLKAMIGGWDDIEIKSLSDNKKMTIGEKRERLYAESNGIYSWMIDDDDDISDGSVGRIVNIIMSYMVFDFSAGVWYINNLPDCITFQEKCMINGTYYSSNHSLKYDDWAEKQDGFDYVRTPFYKDVIKTSIAKAVPFEHIRYGEDHAWARALKPHLKSEVHIDEEIYYYIHNSKPEDHNERYGIV